MQNGVVREKFSDQGVEVSVNFWGNLNRRVLVAAVTGRNLPEINFLNASLSLSR